MGRGTTLVQASLMGRKAARNDVNPPSRSLARPRLRAVSLSQVLSQLRQIDWGAGRVVDKDLLVFYSQKTLAQITALRNWLDKIASIGDDVDPVIDWIRMVALNRFTGHSSGFFSVYTLPPNQAVSVQSQLKINEKRNQTPPDGDISRVILKKHKHSLLTVSPNRRPNFDLRPI